MSEQLSSYITDTPMCGITNHLSTITHDYITHLACRVNAVHDTAVYRATGVTYAFEISPRYFDISPKVFEILRDISIFFKRLRDSSRDVSYLRVSLTHFCH